MWVLWVMLEPMVPMVLMGYPALMELTVNLVIRVLSATKAQQGLRDPLVSLVLTALTESMVTMESLVVKVPSVTRDPSVMSARLEPQEKTV